MGKIHTANKLPRAGQAVMFKQCAGCGLYLEFIDKFWDTDEITMCVYCMSGEDNPFIVEGKTIADFIMNEDVN